MDTFTCVACEGTFQKGWSDEEAKAESAELYGDHADEDMALVCDDCFNTIMRAIGATA